MTKYATTAILFLLCASVFSQSVEKNQRDKYLISHIESNEKEYSEAALQIWDYAEVGYQEYESTKLLQNMLKDEGFKVTAGTAGMPTSFIAEYGSGHPVVAILGEFDALPGITQEAVPHRQKAEDKIAGHACGHHLFGVGSAAAAISVKDWMKKENIKGTLRFYGTPAEEGGAGKVYFVRDGFMDDVDVCLHWHPGSSNSADAASSLANKSAKFRFYGVSSHASASPENGRSSLDAVEAMNYMVNLMREHIPSESRIHYVITQGGSAPNVIPDFAEVFYYCRHPEAAWVEKNFDWIVQAAEGAAQGTQTRMEYEVIHGLMNLVPNETVSRVMHTNLLKVGGYDYDPQERIFAEEIMSTFSSPSNLESTRGIKPFAVYERGSGGSTDVGDVSWVVPTAGLRTATWVPGTSAHSWQAVAAGGTSIGTKGMMVAAKTIALTAADLFLDESTINKAKDELTSRVGRDYQYHSLLGDRTPALDYRNKK